MKENKERTRQNFSVDKKVSDTFRDVCDTNGYNMSKLIENYMKEFIKNNSNKND